MAILVGLGAVCGLGLYARHLNSPAPRVLGQTIVEATPNRGAFIRIGLEPSRALLRLAGEGETWEYRVADAKGKIYCTALNSDEHTRSIDVPYAYGRKPVDPRLEVWHDDRLLGWAAINDMPLPRVRPLHADANASLRAIHLTPAEEARFLIGDSEQAGPIRLVPRMRLPADEYWAVTPLATPLEELSIGQVASLRSGPLDQTPTDVVRVHDVRSVDALRVHVERWRHRSRTERVRLDGLRLRKRGGQTFFNWEGERVPNSLGVDLHRLTGSSGFESNSVLLKGKNVIVPGDARFPVMSLSLPSFSPALANSATASPAWAELGGWLKMAFENPDFHRLHLRGLSIGSAFWRDPHPDPGAVDPRPFGVTIRLTKEWNERVGSFEATIPVEPASSEPLRRL